MTLVDASKKAFVQTWGAAGYRENWEVYGKVTGISEEALVNTCLCPFFNPAHTVLEIGCGGGFWIDRYLRDNFKRVIGLDVLPGPRDYGANVSYIEVPDRDFSCFMVENDSIDFGWSFGVFCHLTLAAQAEYLTALRMKLRRTARASLYFSNTERRKGTGSLANTEDHVPWVPNDLGTTRKLIEAAGLTLVRDLLPEHCDTMVLVERP